MTKFSYVPFKVSNLSFPITVEFSYALSKSSGLTLVPINQYFNYLYIIINFVTASPTYVVTTVAYIPIAIPQLCYVCNMGRGDLPDMYARARG